MSDIQAQARRDAEFDRLLAQCDIGYPEGPMRDAYETGKRHEAEKAPRWHDAPTCAGLWVFSHDAYDVYDFGDGKLMVDDGGAAFEPWEGKWYGPIPDEEVTP